MDSHTAADLADSRTMNMTAGATPTDAHPPDPAAAADNLEAQCDRPPQLRPSSDAAAAYRLVYRRVDALLRGHAEVVELTVPACPAWTVRQTVAHLVGLAQDVVSLNLEGSNGCSAATCSG